MLRLIAFYVILNYLYRPANQIIISNEVVFFWVWHLFVVYSFVSHKHLHHSYTFQNEKQIRVQVLLINQSNQYQQFKQKSSIHLSLLVTKHAWVCESESFVHSGCCCSSFNTCKYACMCESIESVRPKYARCLIITITNHARFIAFALVFEGVYSAAPHTIRQKIRIRRIGFSGLNKAHLCGCEWAFLQEGGEGVCTRLYTW